MVAVKAQVTMPYRNVAPTNVAVNVWSFEIADDEVDQYLEVQSYLTVFYTTLVDWFSPLLDMTQSNIKIYVRSDLEPQVPRFDNSGSFGNTNQTNDPLPEEVAAVMSFRAPLVSGTIPARRRGRIFLGPLGSQVSITGTNGRSVIDPDFVQAVITASVEAAAELVTAGNAHTVWSKTNEANYVVSNYWMDNAFDTQRRRGPSSSTRQGWTIP